MKTKCGSCGKDMLVPDDLVAGQHVRCPYCNEKTAFDKPSRVALPEGFEVKRKSRAKIDEMKRKREQEDKATANETSPRKLGVIRSAATKAVGPDLNAEAIKRRMEVDEQSKRAAEEKAIAAQICVRREKNIRRLIGVGGAAFLVVAVACWVGACSRERTRKRIDALQRQEQRAREESRKHEMWLEEQEKRRAEQEAKRVAEREAAHKAAEVRDMERQAEKKAREALAAAKVQREAERQQNAEAYKSAASAFRAGKFCMADNKKILGALATRDDAFRFCLAQEGEELPIYEVSSSNNGMRRVVKMTEAGAVSDEDFAAFTNRLAQSDYLMTHGQQTFYRATRAHAMTGRLVADSCADPTKVFFDKLYGTVKALDMTCDTLTFDIVFLPKQNRAKKEIPVQTVEFGCECPMSAVRAAVIEAFPMQEDEGRMKVKKFKRSVVFWNGSIIKQSMDGITYVPRCYQGRYVRTSGQERRRWEVLYSQAVEEEEAERVYYEEARQRFEEQTSKANDKARIKWMKTIEDMLANGTIGYRAKIAKEK